MAGQRSWWRVLGPVLVGLLFMVLVGPDLWAALLSNVDRAQSLRGLQLPVYERSLDEAAWDAGWWSLCASEGETAALDVLVSEQALGFSALANIDSGDYVGARAMLQRLADQRLASDEPNALAYAAALDMDWLGAARAYESQAAPRHERWWGTVFYLAAQQKMFEGDPLEAADLYRRADTAYGIHGPYLGLGLVECLIQQGRSIEAWDAYRRALVVMPSGEALTHLSRFEQLRLEGLGAWHERQPENEQVAHWLSFYEDDAQRADPESEALDSEPVPQVPISLDLDGGRALLGLDYRVEDLETGPFMVVDLYVREGQQEQPIYRQVRQTVLNQAPNGAFAWDAVPDGVRPVGWHGLVYSHDLAAIGYRDLSAHGRWLCMDGGAIENAFGLQSMMAGVDVRASFYIQGGDAYVCGGGSLAHGRTWLEGGETTDPYSYLAGGHLQDQVHSMSGSWIPDEGTEAVAVWLFSGRVGRACAQNVYLFAVPNQEGAE